MDHCAGSFRGCSPSRVHSRDPGTLRLPDGRGTYAVPTDQGLEALREAAPGHEEAIRTHLFDQLSPAQVEELGTISHVLAEHLGKVQS
jgi:hypothetical protein